MLESLTNFIRQVTLGESGKVEFAEDDKRLAAAALLFHLIDVDGVVDSSESAKLRQILRVRYDLSEKDTDELIEAAKLRDREAVDLYGFTSVLKRTTEPSERLEIVEMMWEIVFADGEVHEFEDNTIWRVAELLGVSTRDRMTLRHKVAKSSGQDHDQSID
ncbi:MAG: TerB family tellurite resistance protein [Rhodobacteraceae bacterium]|nr:TerB family tellurite resistance protein [Paracoccaceae bacterium]